LAGGRFRFPDAADYIENAGERCSRFQGAFGRALNGWAVGERVAEGDAELYDVGAASASARTNFNVASRLGSPA